MFDTFYVEINEKETSKKKTVGRSNTNAFVIFNFLKLPYRAGFWSVLWEGF